jgi:NADPH-dependent glutamate synthase beta subunit-like oxidoreductase
MKMKDMEGIPIPKPHISSTYETTERNKTGSWRFLKPVYQDRTSPCSASCPAGEDIGRVEGLVKEGRFEEAWDVLLRENPLPGVCGRVCFHPCESACNRKNFDAPVAIHAIERLIADRAAEGDFRTGSEKRSAKKQKIAVIGAGPSGLSAAWFLTMLGYSCDVFEAQPEPGGILRWGIPEYRLPLSILQSEIARIEQSGVRIRTGHAVTVDSLEALKKNYSAVFVGCGLRSSPLGIPGENSRTVQDGLHFLRRVRQGKKPVCDGHSMVVGGGNTAVDVSRTILRLGGRATMVFQEGRQDMSAWEEEILAALEEGVKLEELLTPAAIQRQGDRFRVTLRRMKRESRKDCLIRIIPDGNKTVKKLVDRVFVAAGAGAPLPGYDPPPEQRGVSKFSHCVLSVDRSGTPLLYAGDLANKTLSVAEAIASGKQASMILDTYFERGLDSIAARLAECTVGNGPALSMEIYRGGARRLRSSQVVPYESINLDYFQHEPRNEAPQLAVSKRRASFQEIASALSADAALREAERCFQCGLCNQCDFCYEFCPDSAVVRTGSSNGRQILYDYCKGCGICATECPRSALVMTGEGRL